MRSFLIQDIKRGFTSKGFFGGTVCITVYLMSAVLTYMPLDHSRSVYNGIASVFGLSGFVLFAAIFPGLAYAAVFCEEYNSGYLKMILSRIGWERYGQTRIVSTALSGGVMFLLSFFIIYSVLYHYGIPGVPSGSDEGSFDGMVMIAYVRQYGDWSVFVGRVLLGFFFGCLWATVGLAFAVWIPNRYVALIAPFVLCETLWLLLMNEKMHFWNPIMLLKGEETGSYPLAMLIQSGYFLIAAGFVMWGLKRRYGNE